MRCAKIPVIFLRRGERRDIPLIRRKAKAWRLDDERLAARQFLVAEDGGGKVVGFGRVKPYRSCYELGTVGVEPSWRGRGLGEAIVRRLIRDFPSRKVLITTDLVDYFRRLGFQETDRGPKELRDKISCLCRVKGRRGCRIMSQTKC